MEFEISDGAFFADTLRRTHGYIFYTDSYRADDEAANLARDNQGGIHPYHDLKNPKNRTHISLFDPRLHYIADQSAARHSSVLFVFGACTFHMQRWMEESWRVRGHNCRSEYICLMSLFPDRSGWGLVNLGKMKEAGTAMTAVYEHTSAGRRAACEEIAAFLAKAVPHTRLIVA